MHAYQSKSAVFLIPARKSQQFARQSLRSTSSKPEAVLGTKALDQLFLAWFQSSTKTSLTPRAPLLRARLTAALAAAVCAPLPHILTAVAATAPILAQGRQPCTARPGIDEQNVSVTNKTLTACTWETLWTLRAQIWHVFGMSCVCVPCIAVARHSAPLRRYTERAPLRGSLVWCVQPSVRCPVLFLCTDVADR